MCNRRLCILSLRSSCLETLGSSSMAAGRCDLCRAAVMYLGTLGRYTLMQAWLAGGGSIFVARSFSAFLFLQALDKHIL